MKYLISSCLGLAMLASTSTLPAAPAASSADVDFGTFTPPSGSGQFVEVNLGQNLISLVARLAQSHEPEIAKLLGGLQRVRVNVLALADDNRAEVTRRIQNIRRDLDERGWDRVVQVRENDEDVMIYLKTRGDEAVEGLVVTVISGNNEAVLVNIVGEIDPDQLALVGERLHIEPLKRIGHRVHDL